MATVRELQAYLGDLTAILWNFGAELPRPTLDPYDDGSCGFVISAILPGITTPRPAVIRLIETWEPSRRDHYTLSEYDYDFIEHPLNRRLACHRHDAQGFLREFGVAVHEHCEEVLARPACDHYMGLPIDGYDAIRRFTRLWGQPGPIGCSQLRCIG